MVELTTSPSGMFHQGFHLSVSHRRRSSRKTSSGSGRIVWPCSNVVDVSAQEHGWIASPRHWIPDNTSCTWSLVTNSTRKIWIELHSPAPKKSLGKYPSILLVRIVSVLRIKILKHCPRIVLASPRISLGSPRIILGSPRIDWDRFRIVSGSIGIV